MCPVYLGFISICILWNIIYGHVKANEGAWSGRWRLSSALGKVASSSLGFQGGGVYILLSFSVWQNGPAGWTAVAGLVCVLWRKHSENSTFSLQTKFSQDFCPMALPYPVMLLDC